MPRRSTPPARRAALAVTVHDLAWRVIPEAFPRRGRRWHESSLRHALHRADALVVPSTAVCESVVDAGADPSLVNVIPHGSDHLPSPDEDAADALLRRLGVDGDFLLSVGTLEPRKNLARLLVAYGVAREKMAAPLPLVVVGPSGWGETAPAATAPGVHLAGSVPAATLASMYRRARLLAYVPLLEGFGLPPLEAMAAGTAVVASPMPSTEGAALEVDPADVESIADALVQVADDAAVRTRLSTAGLGVAASRTWAASAAAHRALWDRLS